MPVYACYQGDALGIPLTEPDVFVLEDEMGRTWYCRVSTPADIGGADNPGPVLEFVRFGFQLRRLGLQHLNGQLTVANASSREELRKELSTK
jgi:hypothetical protein